MLGQKLKELREEHQFVQRGVAAKLEVGTAYVSKMANGTKQVSRNWLPILAEMFDVEMYQLEVYGLLIEYSNRYRAKLMHYPPCALRSRN
jgi:transcriptional regulator with XRE-family HTH domain